MFIKWVPFDQNLILKTEKCVLIRYDPNKKKGYKYFNPTTRKVSIDVSFIENQPYFFQKYLQQENMNEETQF